MAGVATSYADFYRAGSLSAEEERERNLVLGLSGRLRTEEQRYLLTISLTICPDLFQRQAGSTP